MIERRFSQLSSSDSGVVSGLALKWGQKSFVPALGKWESFEKGSLEIPEEGIELNLAHDRKRILGHSRAGTLRLRETDQGLYYEADIPKTAEDVRELLKRRDLGGASVEFNCISDRYEGENRIVSKAALVGLSLVGSPCHKGEINYRHLHTPKTKQRKWSETLWEYPAVK